MPQFARRARTRKGARAAKRIVRSLASVRQASYQPWVPLRRDELLWLQGGEAMKSIRRQTKAFIRLDDAIPDVSDRLVHILSSDT